MTTAEVPAPGGTAPGWLAAWARMVAGLTGWRRYGLSALCGICAAAALPPLHLLPLLIPAFSGLLWLADGASRPRQMALLGWSFGFGFFLAGLYWVGISFLVEAERFAWAIPFALAGLSAGLGLFIALAFYLVGLTRTTGLARVFALATAWLLLEGLRTWILTGFPWNLLGSVWSFSPAVLQLAALTGVWGLSFMTVLAAAAPALLGESQRGRGWLPVACLCLLPLAAWAGGSLRLAGAPEGERVPGVRLRIVQPAIEQSLKWDPARRGEHVLQQMRLSAAPAAVPVTHVIWAETAVPFYLALEAELRRALGRIVPPGGLLLTGAVRRAPAGQSPGGPWNSFHALDPAGEIVATYDKFHLVPFGEYVPFRAVLSVAKLTAGESDFLAGPGLRTLDLPGLPPFSPLICYEVIFPGAVAAEGARPAWLLNVTNDAWFGTSSGPYQHFAMARLRAVEEGLPLVRAANTGISGVVDPYGRVVAELGLGETGVLDSDLPRPAAGATVFSRLGNVTLLLILGLGVLLTALFARRRTPMR